MKFQIWGLPSFVVLLSNMIHAQDPSRQELIQAEGIAIYERSFKIASQFYHLEEGENLKEITQLVLESDETRDHIKQKINETGRRFFLFTYPSDGYEVKGYISFVPDCAENNLLLLLRGGNRFFGLMNPATDFSCMRDYTVIATTYRGGVSEGVDQFGGEEVNDVHHLVSYLPTLADKLGLAFNPKHTYMLGGSRGGMEMFLALGKSPALQQQISKAVSLSGTLDIEECIRYREDMKRMFIHYFGLIPEKNGAEWVAARNPINTVPFLRKDLPFLIVQGTDDFLVHLNEGRHMAAKLKENGNLVDYIEIPGGDHCLSNHPNRTELIADWFEKQAILTAP